MPTSTRCTAPSASGPLNSSGAARTLSHSQGKEPFDFERVSRELGTRGLYSRSAQPELLRDEWERSDYLHFSGLKTLREFIERVRALEATPDRWFDCGEGV